jgi:hypothetical protein
MLLAEWCAREGRGAIHRLSLETRLAYTTVYKAAKGKPTKQKTAERIHEATGGEVSIESLLLGDRVGSSRALPDADTTPPTPHEAAS